MSSALAFPNPASVLSGVLLVSINAGLVFLAVKMLFGQVVVCVLFACFGLWLYRSK